MMDDSRDRTIELLQQALDLPPAERSAFIDRECDADPKLLARLHVLLAHDAGDWDLLDKPVVELAASVFPDDDGDHGGVAGQHIGSWRLVRELGRGGMGSVWLAERDDGQFAQQVALKLIKLGMDSEHVKRQFRRERTVLARLQHSNIAQLVDGGTDERGRPWFAMELIDGVGLREWIDSAPPLDRRLALFVKLCRAVAHAHRLLIVHRDLKPSNVMVQANDEPRLLDFGIAKLLEGDASDATRTMHRFATRAYAAPEQMRGEAVSTVTDVYALGILLFELLTGARYSDLRTDGAALTRPSHLVARTAAPTLSAKVLRGDLDAIVMRALAEEPERRYPGAAALASDVQRYLGGQPVKARPDSLRYRTAKYLRRNRAASLAVAFAVIALLAGTIVSWTQMRRAEVMAQRAERGQDFFAGLLQDADPFSDQPREQAGPGRLLDSAITRIERDFADVPEVQINLRGIIARSLGRSGNVAGRLELSQRNAAAARRYYGAAAPQTGVALVSLGIAQRQIRDEASALQSLTLAESLLRDAGSAYVRDRIAAMTGLAALASQNGELAESWRLRQAIVREREALDGPESPDLAMDLMNLSVAAYYDERYVEAEALAQRAHDMIVKLLGPDHARLLYVDNMLGLAQAYAGHTAAGVATLTRVVHRLRDSLPARAGMYAERLSSLARAQLLHDELPASIEALNQALAMPEFNKADYPGAQGLLGRAQLASGLPEAEETLQKSVLGMTGNTNGSLGRLELSQAALGLAMARNGKLAAGEALTRKARADLLAGRWATTTKLGDIDLYLADILDLGGPSTEAHSLRGEALANFQRVLGPDHPRTRALLVQL